MFIYSSAFLFIYLFKFFLFMLSQSLLISLSSITLSTVWLFVCLLRGSDHDSREKYKEKLDGYEAIDNYTNHDMVSQKKCLILFYVIVSLLLLLLLF